MALISARFVVQALLSQVKPLMAETLAEVSIASSYSSYWFRTGALAVPSTCAWLTSMEVKKYAGCEKPQGL